MTEPVKIRGEVTLRIIAPGVRGPIERTLVLPLDEGKITAPEMMKRLDFESDCLTTAERWSNLIARERRNWAKQIEAVAHSSAVLTEVLQAMEDQ